MVIVSLVCSIGAIICYLLCYFLCTERVIVERLILMAAGLKFLYPLDKKTVDANAEILRQKKSGK